MCEACSTTVDISRNSVTSGINGDSGSGSSSSSSSSSRVLLAVLRGTIVNRTKYYQ